MGSEGPVRVWGSESPVSVRRSQIVKTWSKGIRGSSQGLKLSEGPGRI